MVILTGLGDVPTAVAAFRAFQPGAGPGDARTLANFMGLIGVLGWMSTLRATP